MGLEEILSGSCANSNHLLLSLFKIYPLGKTPKVTDGFLFKPKT